MAATYLEIVTEDVDALKLHHERVCGLSFGPPDPDLGQACVARFGDGSLIGLRKPLAAHETPIIRTYLAVDNIDEAARLAQTSGAMLAYGPVRQGNRGSFAILFQGGVQLGLWQQ